MTIALSSFSGSPPARETRKFANTAQSAMRSVSQCLHDKCMKQWHFEHRDGDVGRWGREARVERSVNAWTNGLSVTRPALSGGPL